VSLYRAIVSLIRALSRLINAKAAVLERPEPKPTLESVPTLPDELQGLLEMARHSAQIRARLPEDLRSMLDQEDEEWQAR
jgi:hypothetical protein